MEYKSNWSGQTIDACITFARIDNNGYMGYRLLDKDGTLYAPIGLGAVDFSSQFSANSTNGAAGDYSACFGKGTSSTNNWQFSIGSYNNQKLDTVFEIGIGDESTKKNALEVFKTGAIVAPELDLIDIVTDKSLVTKEYVDSQSGSGGASNINDLTDVDTVSSAPAINDTLIWDGTNWVPGTSQIDGGTY